MNAHPMRDGQFYRVAGNTYRRRSQGVQLRCSCHPRRGSGHKIQEFCDRPVTSVGALWATLPLHRQCGCRARPGEARSTKLQYGPRSPSLSCSRSTWKGNPLTAADAVARARKSATSDRSRSRGDGVDAPPPTLLVRRRPAGTLLFGISPSLDPTCIPTEAAKDEEGSNHHGSPE